MEKLVSIVIINYNTYKDTISCLKSLLNQTYKNFEILIVDNGSKYQLFLKLKEKLALFNKTLSVFLIRSNINLYFGAGNNKAIKRAKGDYICLLNPDTEVIPNFIEEMVKFLEEHPKAAMISPKIKLFSDKNYIWTTGGKINFRTGEVVFNRGYLEYDPDNQKYNKVEKIDFAPGTALFVKKEYLNEIGLMDEIFFMYHEDPDWNFRARQKGFETYYVPTTHVYHKILIKRNPKSKRAIFNDFFFKRNKQILVWKHASILELIIFYIKFFTEVIYEFISKLKRKKIKILILYIISWWKGFRIGLKRRTNRSCRKYLIKDFYFIKNLEKSKF
ncbi:MAG: glycosyltransferase family 2 protein [Candidatus Hermodarchaeota archaeon]